MAKEKRPVGESFLRIPTRTELSGPSDPPPDVTANSTTSNVCKIDTCEILFQTKAFHHKRVCLSQRVYFYHNISGVSTSRFSAILSSAINISMTA